MLAKCGPKREATKMNAEGTGLKWKLKEGESGFLNILKLSDL